MAFRSHIPTRLAGASGFVCIGIYSSHSGFNIQYSTLTEVLCKILLLSPIDILGCCPIRYTMGLEGAPCWNSNRTIFHTSRPKGRRCLLIFAVSSPFPRSNSPHRFALLRYQQSAPGSIASVTLPSQLTPSNWFRVSWMVLELDVIHTRV